jgi:superfamily II DNA or RNA helicase
MQHATIVQGVSFRQKPRRGQLEVFNHDRVVRGDRLSVKLPTGYGKTFTAFGVYAIQQARSKANRLLIIVPTEQQLNQLVEDGPGDLKKAGVQGPTKIIDIRFFSRSNILDRHRKNIAQIFVTTVQSLIQPIGYDRVVTLLETGAWMICVDEYHHYGEEKEWGRMVGQLPRSFLLAMSATPYRPNQDSAFGAPDFEVSYREAAVEDNAVKRLVGHAYDYKLDVIEEDGTIVSKTTSELVVEAGGDRPADIEKLRITRKMRWSPKYVSPLVRVPIERMLGERVRSGIRQQALISALSVSHAELVCNQLWGMFPELEIDWVGTGDNGRTSEENQAILRRFCPPKDEDGIRHPELDVLVHVGMAGEGVDATHVTEVILLRPANLTNQINQIIGRGARLIPHASTANVNFDRSTEFAGKGYVGSAVMDAMDFVAPRPGHRDPPEPLGDGNLLPDEPTIHIHNMELLGIDSGDAGVQAMARILDAHKAGSNLRIDFAGLQEDPNHSDWGVVIDLYRKMRHVEAKAFDEKAEIAQWREAVKNALGSVTSKIIRRIVQNGASVDKSLPGDIKKRINGRKKAVLGEISNDLNMCRAHYNFLTSLEREIVAADKGLPSWLL